MGTLMALFQAGGFISRNWDKLLIAGIVIAWTLGAFWAGGQPYKAKLIKLQADVEAARAEQQIADSADEAASIEFVNNLDREHKERHDTLNKTWDAVVAGIVAERDGLRAEVARAQQSPQSVQSVAGVCADQAGNQRLSDAVAEYRAGVQAVVAEERRATADLRLQAGKLLAACHKQAGDLIEVNRWAEHEQVLWGEDGTQVHLR